MGYAESLHAKIELRSLTSTRQKNKREQNDKNDKKESSQNENENLNMSNHYAKDSVDYYGGIGEFPFSDSEGLYELNHESLCGVREEHRRVVKVLEQGLALNGHETVLRFDPSANALPYTKQ